MSMGGALSWQKARGPWKTKLRTGVHETNHRTGKEQLGLSSKTHQCHVSSLTTH